MAYVFTVPIIVQILAKKQPTQVPVPVRVIISPAQTPKQTVKIEYPFRVRTVPIEVNLSDPIIAAAYEYLNQSYQTYVDEDRQLKTLVNYGEDKQSVALAYRRGPVDTNGINTIQLKLLQPVPADIVPGNPVFLSREVAKTTIDKIRVRFAPPLDPTPYLRPKNLNAIADVNSGRQLRNVTLKRLALQTGSVGTIDVYQNKTFEDALFRQWYSYDFNSSELNLDFTNYANFIYYGSAAMRLSAFRQKLLTLEKIEHERNQFLSSSTYTGTTGSAGFVFIQEKTAQIAKKKEDIIRAFDRYEQYLYFTPSGSISPYSASFAYADTGTEYNTIAYWPKDVSGSIYSPYDPVAEEWFATQYDIANRFDEFNENNLVNTIPTHVREHEDNSSYITFVSMIGHFFDTIKPYIDHFKDIYARNLNPDEDLSKDLINEIAESFGFRLPRLDSTYDLTNEILGTETTEPRRKVTAEIYKRLLHNLVFFAKSKGTKTAVETFLKTFGLTPQVLTIRETGTPTKKSYYSFDEFSIGLDFDDTKSSHIRVPISASARNPKTLQFNINATKNKTMTVLTGDDKWALNIAVHPSASDMGRIELLSGSSATLILSSSYHYLFTEDLFNVTIQNQSNTASLYLMQTDGEEMIFSSYASETSSFTNLWDSTQYVYIGGSGPRVTSRFEGIVDELRLWSETLSEETITNTAYDPGSNAGDTYVAPVNTLLVQLSFNNVNSSSLASSSIQNESPYKDKDVSPSIEELFTFNISGSDFVRYNRTIRQDTVIAGSSRYLTNKVKVADPPTFITQGLPYKRLYRTQSIVTPETKKLQVGRNKVIVALSPTEIINQNIIRNFGYENLNSAIGSPTTTYTLFDKSLNKLKKYYQTYYYIDVNFNKFIRIMSEVGSILDQVVDYFIPSKATLLKGIVIEPNILEQVKIPPVKNIRFYGKNTRKTLTAAGSLSSSAPDYGATFNAYQKIDVRPEEPVGKYSVQRVQYKLPTTGSFTARTDKYVSEFFVNGILSGSTTKLTTTLDELVDTVSGQVNKYNGTVDGNSVQVLSTLASNVTSNDLFEPELRRVIRSSSYVDLRGHVEVDPHSVISALPTYTTGALQNETVCEVHSAYNTYNIKHEAWDYTGTERPSSLDVGLENLNKIGYNDANFGSIGAEPYNRAYTRKLFKSEINTPRPAGQTSLYLPALYDIPPTTDFRDFGVYTYFNNDTGLYYFPETIKTPAYNKKLNQSWNSATQTFESVPTWSYGNKYNMFDVVYQNITSTQLRELPGNISKKDVNGGNGRYYVFKTRPAYRAPTDGTAFYSGSVPSYTPPSLDKDNWELLRFTPSEKRVAKRVVFDTYTVASPELNNFKTTTVSSNKILDIPDRYVDYFSIQSIDAGSYVQGELLLQNIAILFALQLTNNDLRVRFYRTAEARNKDLYRPIEVRPTGSHGVLLDMPINTTNALELTNPFPTLVAGSTPPAGKIYYTIDNIGTVNKIGITLTMYYFAAQIEPRIPKGYLRKHYRFFRDNSTATKRRNYVGCKNTQNTTVDGLPAVQVFLSEGTDLVISPTQTNQEIITGGGGQLNVT
jgi:hypothetical protein